MLKIRLQRTGRKHETTFRIVLTDSKNSTKSGRYKEILGSYDPRKENTLIKGDRVKYWLSVGAEASGTIHNLLLQQKLITGKKINVLPKKTVPKKEEVAEPAVETKAAAKEEDKAPDAKEPEAQESAPSEESAPVPEPQKSEADAVKTSEEAQPEETKAPIAETKE